MAYNHPWLSNYCSLARPCCRHAPDYWIAEVFWLAVLSRGVIRLCEMEKISSNPRNVKVCKFVLRRIRRMADFRRLSLSEKSGYLHEIRTAQLRIEGIL